MTGKLDPRAGQTLTLATARGPVALRPERPADEPLLFTLFRSWMLPDLAAMQADEAMKEELVRLQFRAQMMGYRAQFPKARFDIIEQAGVAAGRLVTDFGGDDAPACIVDIVVLPERRNRGLGKAVLGAILAWFEPAGRRVRCKVLHHNLPSLSMCTGVGFVVIEDVPPFLQLEWRPGTAAPAEARHG